MKTVKLLALSLSLVATVGKSSLAAPRPNIIVIYTDDQGYGDVSCLNPQAKFKTPNIDRLAAQGIAFTNAHCSDTVCTPSRYGLLTGRYCWRTEKKTGVLGAEAKCLIADGRITLASLLRANGYETAMVGKWHLGMDFPGEKGIRDWTKPVADMPLDKGFDYFFGVPASLNYGVLAWFEGRYAKTPPTLFTAKKTNQRHVDYRIMPPYQKTPQATRQALGKLGMEVAPDFVDNQCLTRFTDKAIQWMQSKTEHAKSEHANTENEKDRKPFFVYLPYTSPHYPVCPLPTFWGQGECGGYGEFVIETDFHVGRILDFLEKSGLDENTMIVFSSDNGPENSWKKRIRDFDHHSSGPYRGGKRSIYEGGHRVPLVLRWPKGVKEPGRRWDGLVGQIDLMATIAEILGVKLPDNAGEDSQSFASVLTDSTSKHKRLPLINHAANGRFAITDGRWKLASPHKKAKAELYDLASDPGETTNVIADHSPIAAALQKKLTSIVASGRTTPGDPQSNDTSYWKDLTWITPAEYQAALPRTVSARKNDRPNFLFIIVDDQSPFDLKVYNRRSTLETPTIDRLAAEGIVVDAAHHMGAWVGAVCTSSRHMVMSGRTLWRIPGKPGRRSNPNHADPKLVPPDLARNTMAAVFNRAGYDTMRTCKRGNSYAAANRQFTVVKDATRRGATNESGSAWHADQVLNYLADRADRKDADPFLIYFGFSHPHDPRNGKPELLAKYGAVNHQDQETAPPANPKQPPLPVNYLPKHPFFHGHPNLRDEDKVSGVWKRRDERTIRNEVGRQFACSENIDNQIARVLKKLETMGELDNTYIIYTSDHGMAIGRHGLQGKQNLYEHTWRVPFIVKGPGIEPGTRVRGNIYLLDVLPTLCDLAGVTPPETVEGASFKPVLQGNQPTVRDVLYGVYSGGTKPGMRCVKQGDWKLIKYDVMDGAVRKTQLFNLAENPHEYLAQHRREKPFETNLADDPKFAEKRREMESLLLAEMRRLDDPYRLWDQPEE